MPRKICSMGRLGAYKVQLKDMKERTATFNWAVDSDFFALLEGPEVERGHVQVDLNVTKLTTHFELNFTLKGDVIVQCDRCLDDMSIDIDTTGLLKVKLGADFADEGDVIIVPESDGFINVAWYIYEFVALAIPIKHVHAPGKCNKDMADELDKHSSPDGTDSMEGSEDAGTDPRWDGLKDINFEIDN